MRDIVTGIGINSELWRHRLLQLLTSYIALVYLCDPVPWSNTTFWTSPTVHNIYILLLTIICLFSVMYIAYLLLTQGHICDEFSPTTAATVFRVVFQYWCYYNQLSKDEPRCYTVIVSVYLLIPLASDWIPWGGEGMLQRPGIESCQHLACTASGLGDDSQPKYY